MSFLIISINGSITNCLIVSKCAFTISSFTLYLWRLMPTKILDTVFNTVTKILKFALSGVFEGT